MRFVGVSAAAGGAGGAGGRGGGKGGESGAGIAGGAGLGAGDPAAARGIGIGIVAGGGGGGGDSERATAPGGTGDRRGLPRPMTEANILFMSESFFRSLSWSITMAVGGDGGDGLFDCVASNRACNRHTQKDRTAGMR